MSDWMSSEITLGLGSIALGMLVGRLCARVACWLPVLLEHQWQRDARELLGLDVDKHPAPIAQSIPTRNLDRTDQLRWLSLIVTLHFGPSLSFAGWVTFLASANSFY